jgi:hypothetical protein
VNDLTGHSEEQPGALRAHILPDAKFCHAADFFGNAVAMD